MALAKESLLGVKGYGGFPLISKIDWRWPQGLEVGVLLSCERVGI